MPGTTRIIEDRSCPPSDQRSGSSRLGRAAALLVPASTPPRPAPVAAPTDAEAALALSVEMAGKQIKSILLVEDDKEFSAMMRILLEGIPFQIAQASNGAEAIKRLLIHDFDYILCDMVMPEFPGEMFYRAVERTKPHLCQRFIFMTGYRNDEKINRFIKTVGGLILWKPFKFGELLDAIRMIDSRRPKACAHRSAG
jgi:CheY-like chemotaxis protein